MTRTASRRLSRMFQLIADAIQEEKGVLSELDGAIGDADHGITMSLGFAAVTFSVARLDLDHVLPSELFATAGTAFLNAAGASTGPLYATGFRKAAQALKEKECLSQHGQVAILEAITQGIMDRGKGQRGDKTMLDVWIPATEAAVRAESSGLPVTEMWHEIVSAAESGANATRSMLAARGRASKLGERSLGHVDPGAASGVIIIRAMRDAFIE